MAGPMAKPLGPMAAAFGGALKGASFRGAPQRRPVPASDRIGRAAELDSGLCHVRTCAGSARPRPARHPAGQRHGAESRWAPEQGGGGHRG